MKIREFDFSTDYPAVRELWEQSGPGVQLSPSDEPAEIEKKLTRDPDLFIVLEEEDRILGSVIGGYDGRRGIVYHLAIRPDRRREGLGSLLMNEIEERLQRKGCYKYYLLVRKDIPDLVEFYSTIGCEPMELQVLGKVLG